MKKSLLFALTASAVLMSNAQSTNVFFSEYLEGASNNKALEIYNGTGANMDMADYALIMGQNGNGWSDTVTFPAGTTVADGDVYVIAHGNAIASILAVADTSFTYSQSPIISFNGDDARAIAYVSGGTYTLLDQIGNQVNDPGSSWDVTGNNGATKDNVMRRSSSVSMGVVDTNEWNNGTSMNWTVLHKDSISNLGQHTVTANSMDSVATIADLRAGTIGETYTLTGEAVITMMKEFRNQKFIEDATAAIVIDDNDGIITGTFNRYDGVTNVTGTLGEHNGLMQFSPTEDVTSASSTNNTVTPQVITVDQMNNNVDMYESELVTIESATVASADTNIFENGKNLTITDASGNGVFRTQFYNVDYIETLIPGESDYTGIVGRFNAIAQLSSRDLADIVEGNIGVEEYTEFTMSPNPTSNVLNINFVNTNEKSIAVYNTIGVNVANFNANSNLSINTSSYNSGMYYLVVLEKGNSTVKQFIVK